jgi:ATPase subunit of ABC transporter with duplicated ATPase domains
MSDTLIELVDVEAGYVAPVVGPVSLTLGRGRVVGLVGQNGSGKSTLLKAIANAAHVFGGRIERKSGVSVAWMEQQPPRLRGTPFSGWEYLHFTGADRTPPPPRLASWLDERVDSLSGGQFQLLWCWVALGGSADVVLLDEPTNNLDDESEAVLAEILVRNHDNRGILLVSHDRGFIERVSDQLLELAR